MKLLGHEINAVIFDMDGTLIDSTGLWHEIDKLFFAKRGMDLPKDYAQKIVHLGLRKAAELTRELYDIKETPDEIILEWRQMALEMYHNDVELKPGARMLLDILRSKGLKLSIATANDAELYMPCIMRLGIGEYFDFVADVNSSKEGKNSSKIYLELTEKMNTRPENTLVLEDMPTCIKTVYDAGFVTVAVYGKASEKFDEDKKKNSHLFINNFQDLINIIR